MIKGGDELFGNRRRGLRRRNKVEVGRFKMLYLYVIVVFISLIVVRSLDIVDYDCMKSWFNSTKSGELIDVLMGNGAK